MWLTFNKMEVFLLSITEVPSSVLLCVQLVLIWLSGFKSGHCAGRHHLKWRWSWHSPEVCFGFLSCCRMNPWASSWDQRMQHRAVRMCLCSCFSKSQTGSSKRSLELRASSSMFDCWCHTIRNILSHTQVCTKTLCEEVQWLQGLLPS